MKTITHKIIVLLAVCSFIASCNDDDTLSVLSSTATTGAANLSASAIVLDRADQEGVALTITFQEPDFGYNAGSIGYQILFDLVGGDFSSPEVINGGTDFSVSLTTQDVNQILINLGATPDVASELLVRIETVLSSDTSSFSENSSVTITPYAAQLDLSSRWGLVGSATINGWDGPDMPFYQTTDESLGSDTFVAYVTLVDGAIKIRADNDWAINYGDNEPDTTLESAGNDIIVSAGIYKIIFNENTLNYSIEEHSWGLVGDATINGWDGPDMPFTYDPLFDNWKLEGTLTDGAIKIRFNNDWAINYGDVEPDGILDTAMNNNIAISAGTYLITYNPITLEYSIE